MGGAIKFVARYKDGHTRVVQGWTNTIPDRYTREQFRRGDPKIWDTYLEAYEAEPACSLNSDPPNNAIAPVSYGIFVVDYTTRSIYSLNDYCCPNKIHCGYFASDGPFDPDIKKHLEAGRIQAIEWAARGPDILHPITTRQEALRLFRSRNVHLYMLDLSPWKVHMFEMTKDGSQNIRALLKEQKFEVNDPWWNKWDRGRGESFAHRAKNLEELALRKRFGQAS